MATDNKQQSLLWAKVVAKAWADATYKSQLISDPVTVLQAEGLTMPADVRLTVVEDNASLRHLVLPAMPSEAAGLDEAALGERLAAESYPCVTLEY